MILCNSFLCDSLIAKASERCGNDGFLKENMSEGVPVVGEGEKFYKRILVEADFDLEHILLRFADDAFQQAQGAIDWNRWIWLASGDFNASGRYLFRQPSSLLL